MKFVIEGSRRKFIEENFHGKDMEEAISKFREEYPDFNIDSIDGEEVIGLDEFTGEPIFEDSDYVSDEEGIMVLKKNM